MFPQIGPVASTQTHDPRVSLINQLIKDARNIKNLVKKTEISHPQAKLAAGIDYHNQAFVGVSVTQQVFESSMEKAAQFDKAVDEALEKGDMKALMQKFEEFEEMEKSLGQNFQACMRKGLRADKSSLNRVQILETALKGWLPLFENQDYLQVREKFLCHLLEFVELESNSNISKQLRTNASTRQELHEQLIQMADRLQLTIPSSFETLQFASCLERAQIDKSAEGLAFSERFAILSSYLAQAQQKPEILSRMATNLIEAWKTYDEMYTQAYIAEARLILSEAEIAEHFCGTLKRGSF